MEIQTVHPSGRPRPEQPTEEQRAESVAKTRRSIASHTRAELNAAVIHAASEVSLSAGNEPLHLLYRAAIEKLNEVLEPELGPEAIQKAAEAPQDFTPEATAERIVSFATGFYAAYSENHPEMEGQERLESFLELIRSGIDQGFEEARGILDGLQVLEGDIAANADQTYELIQQGLEAFRDSILGPAEPPPTMEEGA